MTTPLWKRVIARILEALLAIIFISPLVWVIICSFSPQAGSAQSKGWGRGQLPCSVIRKVCPSTCSTR